MVTQNLTTKMINNNSRLFFLVTLFTVYCNIFAQEGLRPLNSNINLIYKDLKHNVLNDKVISNPQKTSAASLTLPFIDDFWYSSRQNYPDQVLWSDSSTYVNSGHGKAPVSIGVATFDGLNKYGYPYTPNLLNLNSSLPADTLTTRAINLSSFSPVDSVVLSFFYQARGNGEAPEATDTLILDFFKPKQNNWLTNVWFQKGNTSANTNDSIFKFAFITLDDTAYFHDGFKFRFRNKATTAGDFDHWNLDYVILDKNRTDLKKDTAINDFTFGYVPTPFLKDYAAMPWRQYQGATDNGNTSVFIRNNGLNISSITTNFKMNFYDATNTSVYTYSNFATNAQNPGYFKQSGWHNFQGFSYPNASTSFTNPLPSSFTTSTTYKIVHSITAGATSDFRTQNDTVVQYQSFKNYYAFDDGSAEGGYYILGQGGKMAERVVLNTTDTLSALRIYFDPVGSIATATTSYKFRINIWNNASGFPGLPLYTDSAMYPVYYNNLDFNTPGQYTLTTPMILNPGTYFIGIQQYVATGITVGFDKNIDHSSALFYNSGSGWTQSAIYGSLMMRPVFGLNPGPVGIKENATNKKSNYILYPNPANDVMYVVGNTNSKTEYTLLNAIGQTILSGVFDADQNKLNTGELTEGIYFLTLKSDKHLETQKLIIRH